MAFRSSELKYQVVLLGPSNAGKTAIMHRIKDGEFNDKTVSTVGQRFETVTKRIRGNKVKLQLVDTAGMEKHTDALPTQIFRKADAVGFVCDITQENALEELDFYVKKVDEHCTQEPVKFVVGNKSDIESRIKINPRQLREFADERGIGIFSDISAKSGDKFNTLINTVIEELLSKERRRHKIVIVGGSQVGKTKLVNMLQRSEKETSPTKVDYEEGVEINDFYVLITDTPGKEPHLSLTPLEEYKDVDGVVFVLNCTSLRSYNAAMDWFEQISGLKGRNQNMQFMFIANDKGEENAQNVVDFNQLKDKITSECGDSFLEKVNANDQAGATSAFATLCEKITSAKWAEDTEKPVAAEAETLNLHDENQKSDRTRSNCCY